jgi:hypothetical protein
MANFGGKIIKTGVYMQRMVIMATATGLLASATYSATSSWPGYTDIPKAVMPKAFQGNWATSAKDCKSVHADSHIRIQEKKIVHFDEGEYTFVKVRYNVKNRGKILVNSVVLTGTNDSFEQYTLSADKKFLIISELNARNKINFSVKYMKCKNISS